MINKKQAISGVDRKISSEYDVLVKDFLAPFLGLILALGIIVTILVYRESNNIQVDREIKKCIAVGGTPIVSESYNWVEFHGCAND